MNRFHICSSGGQEGSDPNVIPDSDGDWVKADDIEVRGVPNLDDCSMEDLAEHHRTFKKLEEYARYRYGARKRRANGEIELALQLERTCDHIYRNLPAWAKW